MLHASSPTTYLVVSRRFRLRSCGTASMHSTTNRLSQEYRSWSSSLLPSKLLASPTLSGVCECHASQYVSIARSPCALEPCHTSFWGLPKRCKCNRGRQQAAS
uniref:Uncharacterized protein n=1 Tax=Anopheles melas TaxID=34690 RepID=A0A182TPC0_9DIPT